MILKTIIILFILISLFLTPKIALAHLAGQPPFFKVNDKYANLYPVPLTSLNDFDLPQDWPQDNYLLNTPIYFELDTTQLPVPPEIVKISKFYWDFGDGTSGMGLKNTHTYRKIGSYIIKIKVDDGTVPEPQLLESVIINVLPDPNYKIPEAVISVNGEKSSDPLTDILVFDFAKKIQIDGTTSKSSSPITSYFWDFGDQQSSTDSKPIHNYVTNFTQIFIVLRVKNSDGFLADNFVEVKNQPGATDPLSNQIKNNSLKTSPSSSNFPSSNMLIYIGGGIIILIILAFIIKSSKKKPQKH